MHNNTHLINNYNNNTNNNQQDDGEHSFISQDEITDINCIEVYMGEWKQDKRTGYGIAERSDGLKYEGEWFNNKKNGYGVTTFKDGTKEEGKYKNNVLATDKKKAKLLLLRSNKIRQKIDAAVNAALKAGQIAQQRADIALARAVNARTKAHAAELAAKQARGDSDYARVRAHEVAPDFVQPGEIKKMPDIPLDIDKMNGYGQFQPPQLPPTGLGDPVAFNNISPNQFRKTGQLDQFVRNSGGGGAGPGISLQDPYLNWQQQSPQPQSNSYTPHSSTPPPQTQSSMLNNMQSRLSTNNINNQFYDPNLIIPAQQLLQQKQFHPSIFS
jgi:junctophilin